MYKLYLNDETNEDFEECFQFSTLTDLKDFLNHECAIFKGSSMIGEIWTDAFKGSYLTYYICIARIYFGRGVQ